MPTPIEMLINLVPDFFAVLASADRTAAYHRYFHWRVLYAHERGTHVLPVGYPEKRPVRLPNG